MKNFKLHGIKINHKFITRVSENIFQREEIIEDLIEYVICISNQNKYEIKLMEINGSLLPFKKDGIILDIEFRIVEDFGILNLIPRKSNSIIHYDFREDDYECEYFSYSCDGGSNLYPEGYIIINHEKFKKL